MRNFYFIILLFVTANTYGQSFTDPVREEMTLYPNPAKKTLWIEVSKKDIGKEDISVYNIIGNKLELEVNTITEQKFSIDVSNLPTGYYLLVIDNRSLKFSQTQKFLKK